MAGRTRGQIQARGKNKWLVRVFIGVNDEGKRIYTSKTVFGTKTEAQAELTKLHSQQDRNTLVVDTKLTVGAFMDLWLKTKTDVRKATYNGYERAIRLHIKKRLGAIRLAKLSWEHTNAFYGWMVEEGYGRSITRASMVLSQALDHAVKTGVLGTNPAHHATVPKLDRTGHKIGKREMNTLTEEQVHLLLEGTKGSRYHAYWRLAVCTGMRPGEIGGLQYSDIDFDRGTVSIQRCLRDNGEGKYLVTPGAKTDGSSRQIDVDQDTLEALKDHKRLMAAVALRMGSQFDRTDFIFVNQYGRWLAPTILNDAWKTTVKKLGLPTNVRRYDLRHTHATILLTNGVHPKAIADRLGHIDANMVMKIYGHVIPRVAREAASIMQTALRRAAGGM